MGISHNQDIHAALKTEMCGRSSAHGVEFLLVRLQHSKQEVRFSLHANPTSFSSAGFQTTDFLRYLGFERQSCAFMVGREAYCRSVPHDLDLVQFGRAFDNAFGVMEDAERHLAACGFILDQPEGWGYFYGKPSGTKHSSRSHGGGDGHTAPQSKTLKTSENDSFHFALSFISGGSDKGWVFHYQPKHPPFSNEVQAVVQFLGLKRFDECPVFDFEDCLWRFIELQEHEDHIFGGNAGYVHSAFDAHTSHFSAAVQALIEAQAIVSPFGFAFLPVIPGRSPIRQPQVTDPKKPSSFSPSQSAVPDTSGQRYEYDVAISFAGSERSYAECLATTVRDNGFRVFYDDFYPEHLWGKDLVVFFDDVYRKHARYCVIFISSEYCTRMWTNHERQSAQARMLSERGQEYILPIRVDDAELPGMAPTLGYLDLRQQSIDRIAELLVSKLRQQ